MFALIKKDIIFTKKWILLSVVYAVVATWRPFQVLCKR